METEKQKDLLIIDNVLKGDKNAYEDIVRRYSSKVCSICYSVVHNYEDAQDLSQEVFLRAYAHLERFNRQSSFYTWLYRIAKNISIDHRRKFSKVHKVEPYEGQEFYDKKKPLFGPREDLKDKETGEIIREAIDELPDEQKEVIVLREINGLSYNEIVKICKCSEGTVMSRLHYARKKLQEKLKSYRETANGV